MDLIEVFKAMWPFINVRNLLLIIIPFLYFYWQRRPNSKFPPGPKGLPFVGILPFLSKYPSMDFKKWSLEKYGPVMSTRFGNVETVVLNTFETINEVLVKNSTVSSNRPWVDIFSSINQNRGLVNLPYGEEFKAQKHFGLKFLRGKGLGKKEMQVLVNDEGNMFVEYLLKHCHGPVDLRNYLYCLTANVIHRVAFGKRYEYDDPDFQKLLNTLKKILADAEDSPKLLMLSLWKHLKILPSFSGAAKRLYENFHYLFDVSKKNIEEHRKKLDPNNVEDYIDEFLMEQKFGKRAQENGFTDFQLMVACVDLFGAGSETTGSTLAWLFVYLMNFPYYEKQIKVEIEQVMGSSGTPTMTKRLEMPITCAFIHEVMRIRTLVPLAVPHETTGTLSLNGYVIPKGTRLIANLHGAHMDPETWSNPEQFNPHRHIDENGKFVASNKIIPFSVGARFCLGESLARVEIFVFFVKILQKYDLSCEKGKVPRIDDDVFANVWAPASCKVKLTPRD